MACTEPRVLIIGCGNLLRGDDGVGPVLIRHLWEQGIPPEVQIADGGTAGMDVAFRMDGMPEVVIIDACRTGAEPGTLYEVPGAEVETPPLTGMNMHAFRWDHAIAFGRWLLKDRYPAKVMVYLIEAAHTEPSMELSPEVTATMHRLIERLRERYRCNSS